jgi:hypothetical protein
MCSTSPEFETIYEMIWRVRTRLPERFGQRCRVLVVARRLNSVLVEFEDGYRVVTSKNFVRPAPPPAPALF